jgi:hypothetical protein
MIDAIAASPRSPCPTLALIYQDQNDDTLTASIEITGLICSNIPPFHLGKPSIYRLDRHNSYKKMRGMVVDMDPCFWIRYQSESQPSGSNTTNPI